MGHSSYISVILPLKLEWEPCYSVPEGVDIKTGDRIKVGFAGRTYTGVVSGTGIEPQTDPAKIKDILSVEEGMERIGFEEIRLWREIAGYYMCSIGEVYKAAYPYGRTGLEEAKALARQRASERDFARQEKALQKLQDKKCRLQLRLEKKKGLAEKARKDSTREAYMAEAGATEQEIASVEAEILQITGNTDSSSSIAGAKRLPLPEGQNQAYITSMTDQTGQSSCNAKITFSPAQQLALTQIKEAFRESKPVVLHGVTGSGKTEIYMQMALDTIGKGRNALYLVPEIALSRQLEERLHEIFGDRLMIFHSGETSASRRDTIEHIRRTEGYMILGTRSSIFLPHHNLGLIIVDEEHDSSYKQDSPAPRYNGRDTALMLSNIHKGCNIILGSATPSLEEQYNCQVGRHILVELKEKFHGSSEAVIEIIDTKAERKKNGMIGNFSRKLIDRIRETLSAGEQVLILRSRRAWSPVLQCEQCGDIPKCPHCNVSLSLHNDDSLRCHYCGFRTSSPKQTSDPRETSGTQNFGPNSAQYKRKCGKCGGPMKPLGAGTQKIEEEAASLFPDARIARLDSDTAQNRNYEKETIRKFSRGEIDILIGTQMVSKGFDFSNLSLVAVIAADSLLGMQDFRADERAHQLLQQLRGRCGRRARRGTFMIQTANAEHPVYQNIAENRPDFCTSLLTERKDFNFPPYTRIVEISVKDRFEDRAERMAFALANAIRAQRPTPDGILNDSVTGPYAPTIEKIADQHIRNIRISLKKNRQLSSEKAALKAIINNFEKSMKYDGHIIINVDPS